jgi:hypothetical protein
MKIEKQTIGWREWVALPELGIPAIKAKVDTGARTSALHAFSIETYREDGRSKVRFGIHPLSRRSDIELFCSTDLIDFRMVKNSGGHREKRYVIRTPMALGDNIWPIDITLTCRDTMLFRMLLGRTAMRNRLIVDPKESYLTGRSLSRVYQKTRKKPKAKRG